MQLNEIHNPHEHASVGLKVMLLVFAIILVGVLGYLVWQQSPEPTSDPSSSSVPTFKTIKTNSYGLSFSLPNQKIGYTAQFGAISGNRAATNWTLLTDYLPKIEVSFQKFSDSEDDTFIERSISLVKDLCVATMEKPLTSDNCIEPKEADALPFKSDSGVSGYLLPFKLNLGGEWGWNVYVFDVSQQTEKNYDALVVRYSVSTPDYDTDNLPEVAKSVKFQ